MSLFGYKPKFEGPPQSVRSTPDSRHSSGNIRFGPNFVCFTPRCGPPGRCPRSSGVDPGCVKTLPLLCFSRIRRELPMKRFVEALDRSQSTLLKILSRMAIRSG
jgi:hypothetical protein